MIDNDIDINDLEEEIDAVKNCNNKEKQDKSCDCQDKDYRFVTVQKEFLRIKLAWIVMSLFLKLLYKIIFLVLLYIAFLVPVIKWFLLNFYFAHYLFFFMFVLLTLDIIFFLTKFMSDVQEILMENIYIETVTKQEKIALD